ncbi:CotH kinase family protein, partial [Flavobacteriales bacterium]|nr:CotH kinase family protein [Flavobacteriales bacterium]
MNSLLKYIVFLYVFLLLTNCKEVGEVKSLLELPRINITYDSLNPERKVLCEIIVGDSTVLTGKIKQRGGSSIGYAKKSYTVKFDDSLSLLGLPANKTWIFNASYLEKSLIRNNLSYDL